MMLPPQPRGGVPPGDRTRDHVKRLRALADEFEREADERDAFYATEAKRLALYVRSFRRDDASGPFGGRLGWRAAA